MNMTYAELAARAERGELTVKPETVRRGTDASDDAQRLLMEATGANSPDDVTPIVLGRPKLGTSVGSSPIVRARVPQTVKDRLTELAARQHCNESDIVRDALTAYLAKAA